MSSSNLNFILFTALVITSCGSDQQSTKTDSWQAPRPGTQIVSADEPIVEDSLNKSTFSVKVVADSNVAAGIYDIDVDYGPNFAESKMTLPKGGEHFTPVIRKADQPYTYIIGFRMPGDTTFYDYYEVSSNRGQTKMRYIKAYTF